jgi:hypothetical protein
MKLAKAIRKQAATAERVAASAADAYVADQMRSLANAFKAQAEANKRKKKKKNYELLRQGDLQPWGNCPSTPDP